MLHYTIQLPLYDLQVGGLCDLVGTNLAGLRHLQDRLEEQRGVEVTKIPLVLPYTCNASEAINIVYQLIFHLFPWEGKQIMWE